jgi:hypothetical protein
MTTANEHQMLFDIAAGYLEMRAAVRGAKAGLGRGLVAPDAVFPLMPLPTSPRTGSAEPALVLALSRQESEFNARGDFWRRCTRADADDPALCAGGSEDGRPAVQVELADG